MHTTIYVYARHTNTKDIYAFESSTTFAAALSKS